MAGRWWADWRGSDGDVGRTGAARGRTCIHLRPIWSGSCARMCDISEKLMPPMSSTMTMPFTCVAGSSINCPSCPVRSVQA